MVWIQGEKTGGDKRGWRVWRLIRRAGRRLVWQSDRSRGGDCGERPVGRHVICFMLSISSLALPVASGDAQELIVSEDLTANALSQNEARLYFTMRLEEWPNKQPVQVFVLPDDHPLHQQFAKTVLGLFPYQLRRVWDRQLFSGTGRAPITVDSEAEMLSKVTSTPGAIGYVSSAKVPAQVDVLEVR